MRDLKAKLGLEKPYILHLMVVEVAPLLGSPLLMLRCVLFVGPFLIT